MQDLRQRMTNLDRANRVRVRRAKDKKLISRGQLDPAAILDAGEEIVEQWANAQILELLLCIRKVGRVKAQNWLRMHHVSPTRRLHNMTIRERTALATHIGLFQGRTDRARAQFEAA